MRYLFKPIYVIFTLIWCFFLMFLALLPSKKPIRKGAKLWAFVMLKLLALAGVKLEVRNGERLERGDGFVVAPKHMSFMDVVIFLYLRPDMTALAKQSLFRVPFVGQVFYGLGIIPIDRSSGRAHEVMPRVSAKVKAMRRPLVVYPEGTRTAPGQRRRLKTGAFYLQHREDLPVIPIATNTGLFWSKARFALRPGTAIFEVGEEMPHDLDKDAFMNEIARRVIGRSDELMREAGADIPADLPLNPERSAA